MTPPRTHPTWRELVAGRQRFQLENLAARMLVTRLRLRTVRGDEPSIQEAIAAAYDFFERNEATTQEDMRAIFGEDA